MVISNILAVSYVEKMRLIIDNFHKLFSGKTASRMLLFNFTVCQAFSLAISGFVFNTLLLTLDISTTSVELLNNTLAAMILEQLGYIGSALTFSIFKGRYRKLAAKENYMTMECQNYNDYALTMFMVMVSFFFYGQVFMGHFMNISYFQLQTDMFGQ